MRGHSMVVRSALAALAIAASLATVDGPAGAQVDDWFNEYAGPAYNVTGTYTPVVGDFGGSAQDDILWYAPGSGTESLWVSDGDGTFTKSTLSRQVGGTYQPVVGDFGGPGGRDDILWYAPGTGVDSLWITSDEGPAFTVVPKTVTGTYRPFVVRDSDYANGETDDIFWYAPGSGSDSLWVMNGASPHTSKPMTIAGSPQPLVGDFNDDGVADIFWYTPGTTPEEYWRHDGLGSFIKSGYNVGGTYQPQVQDFTYGPDGPSDILWFRPGAPNDPLWEGQAGGGFATSTQNVTGTGMPFPMIYQWGYLWTWSTTAPDRAWYLNEVGPAWDEPTLNTEIGPGYIPIVGLYENDNPGIFWYKPGTAPERLFL